VIERVREAMEVWDGARREALFARADDPLRGVLMRLGAYAQPCFTGEVDREGNPLGEMTRDPVAPDPSMSEAELVALAAAGPHTRALIAPHPATTAAVLAALLAYPDARPAVAGHQRTPAETLVALADDRDRGVRVTLAINRRVPSEVLVALATDPDDGVRATVARRSDLTDELWTALAHDASLGVRAEVADNPDAPIGLLSALARDPHKEVVRRAKGTLAQIARRGQPALDRAIQAFRAGQPDAVPCPFCHGVVRVAGQDTIVVTTCPCKRMASSWRGL
jgi:hypothetical protein